MSLREATLVVPLLPSSTLRSTIERAGGPSSSLMVNVWIVLPPKLAFDGFDKVNVTVSFGSSSVSSASETVIFCVVVPAANVTVPAEALRALEGRRPQLIIADYRLAAGEADGVTQAVRLNAAAADGRIPMLLVTGSVEPEVAEQAQAHGLRVVYKPAGRERLLRAVAQVLEAGSPAAALPPPRSPAGEVLG